MSGKRGELSWTGSRENVDFYDMKGVLEGLLSKLGVTDYKLVGVAEPYLHPGKCCGIEFNGKLLGSFGEVHPSVAEAYAVAANTYVLEMEIEELLATAMQVPQYRHLPKHPGTSRDIAVVVPQEVSTDELVKVIKANAGSLLQQATVFDIYTGKQVAEGYKSMAFKLTFQAEDRTLTDAEIDEVIKTVVAKVGEAYQAKLRE